MAAFLLTLLLISTPLIIDPKSAAGQTLSVFGKGDRGASATHVESKAGSPPRPLYLVTPTQPGTYPIFLFAHGTMLRGDLYSILLAHIASHGYIVVAPLLCDGLFSMPSQQQEINFLANVTNWLRNGLPSNLPDGVVPDFDHLAVGGHSKGGKSAFALALGYADFPLELTVSALIGVDPVSGVSRDSRTHPEILTYKPESFNLSIPVTVIGTGLGNVSQGILLPPCAPNEVNHVEFYDECKAPKSHFVPAKYGHMEMVDGVPVWEALDWVMDYAMCKGRGSGREEMRSTVGGIVVAFLNAYFHREKEDYMTILKHPGVSPATLQTPQYELIKSFESE